LLDLYEFLTNCSGVKINIGNTFDDSDNACNKEVLSFTRQSLLNINIDKLYFFTIYYISIYIYIYIYIYYFLSHMYININSMGLLNITMSTMIAILYNLFVHHLTSSLFKNNDYEDKINKSIILLLISGTLAVVMSKLLFTPNNSKNKKQKNTYVVSNGLWLGGILLIVTSIFVNWQDLSEDIKLIMIGVTLVSLIYYSKQTLEYEEDNESEDLTILKDELTSEEDISLDVDKLDEMIQ
jgi:hypothetical protein